MRLETLEYLLTALRARPDGAYPQMVVAASFARLGEHDRAKAIFAEARTPLDRSDPVHEFLVGAFGAFLDEIASGASARDFLVQPLCAKLGTLKRVPSYTAARFVTAMTTDDAGFDPLVAYRRGDSHHIQERPWKALPMALRAAKAENLLDTNPIDCVEILHTLDEARALPILVRLRDRPATTIELAGKFGWGELVPDALAALLALHRELIQNSFPKTLRALRRLGLRDEAVQLIAATAPHTGPSHLLTAGAWVWLDDSRGRPILDNAHETVPEDPIAAMPRLRAIARGYALASLSFALVGTRRLAMLLPTISDDFGTSAHFPLALVHLTASICSIVDDALTD